MPIRTTLESRHLDEIDRRSTASLSTRNSPLTVPLSVQNFLIRLSHIDRQAPTSLPAGFADYQTAIRRNDARSFLMIRLMSRNAQPGGGRASFQPKNILDLSRAQSGAAQIDPKLKKCLVPALGWGTCHFRIAAARHCAKSSGICAASPAGIISRTFQSFASVRRQWERRSRRQSVQAIVGAKDARRNPPLTRSETYLAVSADGPPEAYQRTARTGLCRTSSC